MAKFSEVFSEQVEKPASSKIKTKKIQFIHYSKLVDSAYQYRERNRDMVRSLADLIKADGEILEPCIVRKAGAGSDSFELIAGHKRTLAAKYLVEEELLEEFAFLPCIEKTFSDIRAEFAVYSTNGYDEKTPYEIMREIEGMTRLLKEYPEEFPEFAGKGRLVEKLAAKMKMSRSVISDYQNISHNLGERGMQSFREGKIDKSAAVALASMPEKKQEEILEKGLTKREEIRSYTAKKGEEPRCKSTGREEKKCAKKMEPGVPFSSGAIEKAIFDLTVRDLLSIINLKSGSIKIIGSGKSFVWDFKKEKKQYVIHKTGLDNEVLPGQMDVGEFL